MDKLPNISINFEVEKMEDHILEMFECFNCDSTKSYLRNKIPLRTKTI